MNTINISSSNGRASSASGAGVLTRNTSSSFHPNPISTSNLPVAVSANGPPSVPSPHNSPICRGTMRPKSPSSSALAAQFQNRLNVSTSPQTTSSQVADSNIYYTKQPTVAEGPNHNATSPGTGIGANTIVVLARSASNNTSPSSNSDPSSHNLALHTSAASTSANSSLNFSPTSAGPSSNAYVSNPSPL
eukprot:CAMPEP_0175078258 /NCGR_PEP_ID=MMETSP0052_2-20121109/23990_1 /TAXON_ID=51329 ORGANISM="Polytomella parva, Strain SAG 63-3" /NCGR_SAMPLE_ID=MMETSP0052_2 /ASSEMBLY_ACC=CAM_ASM_000194 /LENGTH=189 /DNA_ID=CAMNT_0016348103 /DNA_START=14 /DNA_END=580 /DNA_ORIENTATION=+